jgi:hypothetical protein
MSTSLEIVRIPVLNDNYVWLMREPQSVPWAWSTRPSQARF